LCFVSGTKGWGGLSVSFTVRAITLLSPLYTNPRNESIIEKINTKHPLSLGLREGEWS